MSEGNKDCGETKTGKWTTSLKWGQRKSLLEGATVGQRPEDGDGVTYVKGQLSEEPKTSGGRGL